MNIILLSKYLKNFIKPRNFLYFKNEICLNSYVKNKTEIVDIKYKEKYNCIYMFKYINHLRLFSRIKIYQTGLSILTSIGSCILYNIKIIQDINILFYVNGAMLFALLMLYVISRYTVKIGKIIKFYVKINIKK